MGAMSQGAVFVVTGELTREAGHKRGDGEVKCVGHRRHNF